MGTGTVSVRTNAGGRMGRTPEEGMNDVEGRMAEVARDADLTDVAALLAERRAEILGAWLREASAQPFHAGDTEHAVADHIPRLFDALVVLLRRDAQPGHDVTPPLSDPDVEEAARAHAGARFEQGLGPADVSTEFRLLRQEIGRALAHNLPNDLPAGEAIAAHAVVDDAIDGASAVAMVALSERVELIRTEFLAITLHDVRQPMTIIEGSLALASRRLAEAPADLAAIDELLRDAMVASLEMTATLDTLSDASRLAMGALELNLEPAELRGIVAEGLELLGPEARARIVIEPVTLPAAIGEWDTPLLRRVFRNLCSNALKYSAADQSVRIVATVEDEAIHLEVIDQGIGLEPHEVERLFERYSRADGARHRGIPGAGLGLYASRGIVRAHGGDIWLESDGRDKGTSAHVRLPLARLEPYATPRVERGNADEDTTEASLSRD
jgi:signal transduction histidine kinase